MKDESNKICNYSFSMMREEELIKKARQGEKQAFSELYDCYLPKIYRFALLKTGNKETAEDIAHQAFLNAWRNITRYENAELRFSSWLFRIANNLVIDYYRTKKSHIPIEKVENLTTAPVVESFFGNLFDRKKTIETVKSLIPQLPTKQQTVVIMKFVEEFSNKEIAEVLQKAESSVRVLQHRALKKLKTLLEQKNEQHRETT